MLTGYLVSWSARGEICHETMKPWNHRFRHAICEKLVFLGTLPRFVSKVTCLSRIAQLFSQSVSCRITNELKSSCSVELNMAQRMCPPRRWEQLKWRRRRESREISWFYLQSWRGGGQGGCRKGREGKEDRCKLGKGMWGTWIKDWRMEICLKFLLARCRRCVAEFFRPC